MYHYIHMSSTLTHPFSPSVSSFSDLIVKTALIMVIEYWYLGPMGVDGGHTDAPIPAKSKLTIGFGDGGAHPWQFHLNDDEAKDVGFLKLFLTTSSTDFSSVVQGNPFESEARYHRQPENVILWGSVMATIVQIRQAIPTST
jgi:hypothetical protein